MNKGLFLCGLFIALFLAGCGDDEVKIANQMTLYSRPDTIHPKETGTDLQTERINENDQSETFCVVQHLRIDRKPKMAGEDACKKNKSDSQGNSPEMHSSQAQTNGRNQ